MFLSIINAFINISLLFIFSLTLRIILEKSGQSWIKTKSHTATLTILPIVTFVITKVISGNIALSLGMVGALSIVRFRNPVRSPLELTLYFTAITMGIAASVSRYYLVFLIFSIYLVTFLLFLISYFSNKYIKKQFFINSFSEGSSLCTLEIEAKKSIKEIEDSKYIKSISYSRDQNIKYLLASSDFDFLKNSILELKQNINVINFQLNEG
tara:strand:+ start:4874 stop:5506 length:633 start_codon:yes stop_codon:yes gene_type:complete